MLVEVVPIPELLALSLCPMPSGMGEGECGNRFNSALNHIDGEAAG
jgi:hypothetical protein